MPARHPVQRAEQQRGEDGRIEGADRAVRDAFGDQVADRHVEAALELPDAVARGLIERPRADQHEAAAEVVVLRRGEAAHEDAQPFQHGNAAVLHPVDHRIEVAKRHHQALKEDALLVVDVVVERRLVDAQLVGNHVQRRRLVAVGREQLRRGPQDGGALVLVLLRARRAARAARAWAAAQQPDGGSGSSRSCGPIVLKPRRHSSAARPAGRQSEVGQDGARVLADHRRAVAHGAGRLRQLDRHTRHRHRPLAAGLLDLGQHLARREVRVLEDFLRVVDRAERHLAAEQRASSELGARRREGLEQRGQRRVVFPARSLVREARIVDQLGHADQAAQRVELRIVRRRDDDHPVLDLDGAERRDARMPLPTGTGETPR